VHTGRWEMNALCVCAVLQARLCAACKQAGGRLMSCALCVCGWVGGFELHDMHTDEVCMHTGEACMHTDEACMHTCRCEAIELSYTQDQAGSMSDIFNMLVCMWMCLIADII